MPIPEIIQEKLKKNDPHLTHLNLINLGLDDRDMYDLVDLLETNPYVISLDLERNNITSDGAKTLALLKLTVLNVRQNKIDDQGAKVLLDNVYLKDINLSMNALTNDSAELVLQLLQQEIKKMKRIDIRDNSKVNEELIKQIEQLQGRFYSLTEPQPIIDLGNSGVLANLLSQFYSTTWIEEEFSLDDKAERRCL